MSRYWLIALLSLFSYTAHGTLNKWVDAEGKVHYSDQPPPENVKAQVLVAPSTISDVPAQKTIAESEAERKKNLKAKTEAAQKASAQHEEALVRQRVCTAAKANLRTLESNSPVSTFNDKGERVNMDDSARQQNLIETRRQVTQYCD